MEPWSQARWEMDQSPWTIWIFRDSFLNGVVSDNILRAIAHDSGGYHIALEKISPYQPISHQITATHHQPYLICVRYTRFLGLHPLDR